MSASTSAKSTSSTRSVPLPSGPVLVAAAYVVCVLGLIAVFLGEIAFSDQDPHRSQEPIDSIISVGLAGTTSLVIGVGLTLWLVSTPERARIGALVLGTLSVITLPFFWSGAPAVLGACAAWLAGVTRGARVLGGAARVAGIVGVFVVLLNIVLAVGGVVVSAF